MYDIPETVTTDGMDFVDEVVFGSIAVYGTPPMVTIKGEDFIERGELVVDVEKLEVVDDFARTFEAEGKEEAVMLVTLLLVLLSPSGEEVDSEAVRPLPLIFEAVTVLDAEIA